MGWEGWGRRGVGRRRGYTAAKAPISLGLARFFADSRCCCAVWPQLSLSMFLLCAVGR